MWTIWAWYALLLSTGLAGLLLAILGLPGIWLIVLAMAGYAIVLESVSLAACVVVLIGLGVVAEILETALGGVAAKKAGASKRGVVAAILGGLVGGLVATFLIPIPIVGTLIGACAGAFALAFVVELVWLRRSTQDSLAIGYASAKGRLFGLLTKLAFGMVMLVTAAVWGWPAFYGGTSGALPVPASAPAAVSGP